MPVDNAAKIAELEELLDSGATSVTVDGVTTAIDHVVIRRRIRELQQADETQRARRPIVATIRLG